MKNMDDSRILFPPIAKEFMENCIPKIKKSLSLNFDDDATAKDIINGFFKGTGEIKRKREAILKSRREQAENAAIFAPGPSLEEIMDNHDGFKEYSSMVDFIFVDGAAKLALERGLKISLLITDLDGLTHQDIFRIHDDKNALVIIHCHGDNIQEVKKFLSMVSIDERYIFTTQSAPSGNVYNWGGFTDGDRAIFAAFNLGYQRIYLVSMDVDADQIGRFSKENYKELDESKLKLSNHPIKEKKLEIATKTLKWLSSRTGNAMLFTLGKKIPFNFIKNVDAMD